MNKFVEMPNGVIIDPSKVVAIKAVFSGVTTKHIVRVLLQDRWITVARGSNQEEIVKLLG